MGNRSLRGAGITKFALALVAIAFILIMQIVGVFVVILANIPDESLWSSIIVELFSAVAAVGCVVALGGRSWASTSWHDISFTFRFGWWCLTISVGLVVIEALLYRAEIAPLGPDALRQLGECALFCLCIGIFEEFLFRGIIFGGLLALMGGTHRGVVRAVFISSLVFGLAHVDFADAGRDLYSVAQAVLKVIQTGMYAILLCVIVLRTKRLGGASLYHGLDDFILIAPSIILFQESFDTDYISEGDDALPTIMYYLFIIMLYVPFVVKALRELRRGQDVCRGPFMEREVELARRQEQLLAAQMASGVVPAPAPMGQPVLPAPPRPYGASVSHVTPRAPEPAMRPAAPKHFAGTTVAQGGGRPPVPSGLPRHGGPSWAHQDVPEP